MAWPMSRLEASLWEFSCMSPRILMALVVAVFSALGILKLKERAGLYGDTAIAIISSLGMALGIILVSAAGSYNVDLFGYLFGNVLAIEAQEVWMSFILALAVLSAVALFYQEFVFLTFDPESAKVSGVRVKRLDAVMAVLTAVTVVLGMKVVGILLVSALMVIPAAASLQVARSFKEALFISAVLAGITALCGLVAAFYSGLAFFGDDRFDIGGPFPAFLLDTAAPKTSPAAQDILGPPAD